MELGLTADTRRPVATAEAVDAAAAAGFAALGLVSGRFDDDAPGLLAAAGLRCHELLGLQVGDDLVAADALADRLAEDAATVGADWVLVTFQATAPAAAVRRWAARFEDAGSGLAVEFSPLGPVASLADGLEVVAGAGPHRASVVVDAWNVGFGPTTWADLEEVPLDAVAHLQFTDALAPLGEPDLEEAMSRRALPGDGVLELDRFVATFRDRGWDGLVSMQVLSDELRRLPFAEYARRVFEAGARSWG